MTIVLSHKDHNYDDHGLNGITQINVLITYLNVLL